MMILLLQFCFYRLIEMLVFSSMSDTFRYNLITTEGEKKVLPGTQNKKSGFSPGAQISYRKRSEVSNRVSRAT